MADNINTNYNMSGGYQGLYKDAQRYWLKPLTHPEAWLEHQNSKWPGYATPFNPNAWYLGRKQKTMRRGTRPYMSRKVERPRQTVIPVRTSFFGNPSMNLIAFGSEDFGSSYDFVKVGRSLKPIPSMRRQKIKSGRKPATKQRRIIKRRS